MSTSPAVRAATEAVLSGNYDGVDHQVWVLTPQGGFYAYRTGLIFSVARQWAEAWNNNPPGDVPTGSTFIRVKASTTYAIVA